MRGRLTWTSNVLGVLAINCDRISRVRRVFNEIARRGLLANALRKLYWAGALISARNMLRTTHTEYLTGEYLARVREAAKRGATETPLSALVITTN